MGISVEPPEKAQKMVDSTHATFPILSDEQLTAIRGFGVEDVENGIAWPSVFIVGQDGKVRWRSLSDRVKTRPTADTVLEALDAYAR